MFVFVLFFVGFFCCCCFGFVCFCFVLCLFVCLFFFCWFFFGGGGLIHANNIQGRKLCLQDFMQYPFTLACVATLVNDLFQTWCDARHSQTLQYGPSLNDLEFLSLLQDVTGKTRTCTVILF